MTSDTDPTVPRIFGHLQVFVLWLKLSSLELLAYTAPLIVLLAATGALGDYELLAVFGLLGLLAGTLATARWRAVETDSYQTELESGVWNTWRRAANRERPAVTAALANLGVGASILLLDTASGFDYRGLLGVAVVALSAVAFGIGYLLTSE